MATARRQSSRPGRFEILVQAQRAADAASLGRKERKHMPPPTHTADDAFLFHQGAARGLSKVRFHDWDAAYADAVHIPNVARLTEQAEALADCCAQVLRARTR
jgi:hypothetical protein